MSSFGADLEQDLVRHVRDSFGPTLDSVTLYGSYVSGPWKAGRSDINVLILLTETAPERIRQFGADSSRFLRRHRITPLILTAREFSISSDVFPMEYADILAAHRTLAGTDPTETLDLQPHNLRHQLEHQLRGNLVALRQLNLANRRRSSALRRELVQWFSPLAAVFRGMLRLAGETEVPKDAATVIQHVAQRYEINGNPFLTLSRARESFTEDPFDLCDALDRELSILAQKVDALRGDRSE